MKLKKALIPGSFDPITLGHLDIISRTAALFDEVTVSVFENSEKHYLFDSEIRLKMVREACSELNNVKADISHGLLAEYVLENNFDVIVKGVRNASDFDYEYWLSLINRSVNPAVETLMIPSKAELQHISSTVVKELIKYGRPLDGYVPHSIISIINLLTEV